MGRPDPVLVKFGRNLRKYREDKSLTQEQLAEKANLDRTYISDMERGMRNAGIKNIVRLARALGISSSQLMEGVGETPRGGPKP